VWTRRKSTKRGPLSAKSRPSGAIDHWSGKVLAYVFGHRKDEVFVQLKALLEPFGIRRYHTDYWGAYTRHLAAEAHTPGKRHSLSRV
jgi:IS1 family transposase